MIYFDQGYLYNTIWKAIEELAKGDFLNNKRAYLNLKIFNKYLQDYLNERLP